MSIIDDSFDSIGFIARHPIFSAGTFICGTAGILSAFPQLGVDGVFYASAASGAALIGGSMLVRAVRGQIQATIEGQPTRFDHMLAPGGYRRAREDESLEEYIDQTVVRPTPNRPFVEGPVVDADENYHSRKSQEPNQLEQATSTILMGRTRRGPVLKSLKELKNILILGLPGQGKSSLACWILSQMIVNYNAQIIILDRHARDDESLSAMLSPFERRFLLPPAYRFEDMQKSIESSNGVLNDRMEGVDCNRHPIIFVVDEFTDLMKSKKLNGLEDCVEGFNAMGRKYGCFSLCIGQLSNASRTGGTEIRELFATKLLVAMSKSQASMIVEKEYAEQVSSLVQGEFLFAGEGREEPFIISFEEKKANYYNAQASLLRDEPVAQRTVGRDTDELDIDDLDTAAVAAAVNNPSKQPQNDEITPPQPPPPVLPDGWTQQEADFARWSYERTGSKEKVLASLGKKGANSRLRSELDQILEGK